METEGPATRRVQVSEHPRWGRGDTALWNLRVGAVQIVSRTLGFSLGLCFCPQKRTESLGFCKAAWLGLQERPQRKRYTLTSVRVVRFDLFLQIPLFLFLLTVVHSFLWAVAEMPKLTLNPWSLSCLLAGSAF